MLQITPDDVLAFASTLAERELHTLHQGKPFKVKVEADNLIFVNSKENEREHGGKYLEAVCKHFSETNSLHPGEYRNLTLNASYSLALIAKLLGSVVDGTTKLGIAKRVESASPPK